MMSRAERALLFTALIGTWLACSGVLIDRDTLLLSSIDGESKYEDTVWVFRVMRLLSLYFVLRFLPLLILSLRRARLFSGALLFVGLSTVWSAEPVVTVVAFINLILAVGLVIICVNRLGISAVLRAFWAVAALVVSVSMLLLVLEVGSDLPSTGVRGVFATKNTYGTTAALVILLGLRARKLMKLPVTALVFALSCSLLSLYASKSAGSAAALVLALILPKAVSPLASSSSMVSRLLLFVALAVVAIYWDSQAVLSGIGRDATLSGRTIIWAAVLPLTLVAPWVGVGYSASGGELLMSAVSNAVGGAYGAVDNAYLLLALDMGWPFVACYIAWLLSLILRSVPPELETIRALAVYSLSIGLVEKTGGLYLSGLMLLLLATYFALAARGLNALR